MVLNHSEKTQTLTIARNNKYTRKFCQFSLTDLLKEFDRGARHAATAVSNCLVSGDLENLAGLVTPKALEVLEISLR